MNVQPGDVLIVDKFARPQQRGIIAYRVENMDAVKIPRLEKLIYAGLHESGDYLFLHRGMLIRAPFEIFKYLISLRQFTYRQQVLAVLNR